MRKFYSRIESYYKDKLERFSFSDERHRALGWESRDAQYKRFSVLCNFLKEKGVSSILDVGCGLGDLYQFLKVHDIDCAYTGVDILPDMVERASSFYPGACFVAGDVFTENSFSPSSFDVVYSCGVFNLRVDDNYAFLDKAFEVFYSLSSSFVVCSMLSDSSVDKEYEYFYYNREKVRGLASSHFPYCFIVDNYLINDMTVFCSKGRGL
ncbi:class I SAM-dependent methyltransferase [Spirochaetia bacterium 38H-sp]|uniref:Class I SAM-dependent methyltransferase n=1 Tax=Rarispira pelagica TaxID=3141764 RepID=A0ABU9UC61_9SPIR